MARPPSPPLPRPKPNRKENVKWKVLQKLCSFLLCIAHSRHSLVLNAHILFCLCVIFDVVIIIFTVSSFSHFSCRSPSSATVNFFFITLFSVLPFRMEQDSFFLKSLKWNHIKCQSVAKEWMFPLFFFVAVCLLSATMKWNYDCEKQWFIAKIVAQNIMGESEECAFAWLRQLFRSNICYSQTHNNNRKIYIFLMVIWSIHFRQWKWIQSPLSVRR